MIVVSKRTTITYEVLLKDTEIVEPSTLPHEHPRRWRPSSAIIPFVRLNGAWIQTTAQLLGDELNEDDTPLYGYFNLVRLYLTPETTPAPVAEWIARKLRDLNGGWSEL